MNATNLRIQQLSYDCAIALALKLQCLFGIVLIEKYAALVYVEMYKSSSVKDYLDGCWLFGEFPTGV